MKQYKYSLMFLTISLVGLFGQAGFNEAHLTHMAEACKVLGIVSVAIGAIVGYAVFLDGV